jgi:hypothetical protein
MAAALQLQHASGPSALTLFSVPFRIGWCTVFCVLLVAEVVPLPPVAPIPLYSYLAAKVVLFAALGFLTPLTFWTFKTLGFGILFSIVTTAIVEFLQSFSPGHRASYLELLGKLVLLFSGFAVAITARHDLQIKIGPIRIPLYDPFFHLEP